MHEIIFQLLNKNAKDTEKAWATVQWHTARWCCGFVLISCLAILAGCKSVKLDSFIPLISTTSDLFNLRTRHQETRKR